jgi:hypothetical protein
LARPPLTVDGNLGVETLKHDICYTTTYVGRNTNTYMTVSKSQETKGMRML